jgi:CheY-like chemotaxis protein
MHLFLNKYIYLFKFVDKLKLNKLHFNTKRRREIDYSSSFIPFSKDRNEDNFESNRLILIDTMRIDNHFRLTFTKKVKNIFHVESGDFVIVYQDRYSKDLLFNVQRGDNVVDNWVVKRKKSDIELARRFSVTPSPTAAGTAKVSDAYLRTTETKNKIPKILVVDDQKDILYAFKEILSDHGYNVKAFAASKEAVKHLVECDYNYDLAVVDIRMPHINGFQLYQIMKIINKKIKVLFVSALDVAEELTGIFPEIELNDIIKKPVSNQDFITKVKESILELSLSFFSFLYLTAVIAINESSNFLMDLTSDLL